MTSLSDIYKPSLALLTDLYQLTMAYGYWKSNSIEKEAVFNLFFRKNPFKGGFAIACGLHYAIDYLQDWTFTDDDVAYLGQLKGQDGNPLFEEGFLDYIKNLKFQCDVKAIPEGTVVFAHEPLIRVEGPILQCQIIETALLNIINFHTLIATKAARLRQAAGEKPILEFGLRRAHGLDGALTASWAAYVGGCDATSNVLAGKLFGIPVNGTHAHSWVMSFDDELEAFKQYARAMPNNCVFLVDTYDTINGVKNAIEVGKWLRGNGHELIGVRLDSGDLAYLSIAARKLLDEGGFPNARIVASNDLDEHIIDNLNAQGAQISVWGVGTQLVTAYDQPAIGGVYKLTAVRKPGQEWEYKVKLSEQSVKVSNPGIQQVRRFYSDEGCIADMIFDEPHAPLGDFTIVDPLDMTRRKILPKSTSYNDLLVPIFERGRLVYDKPDMHEVKRHAQEQLKSFHATYRRLLNPHQYPVGLELGLHELKTRLVLEAREVRDDRSTAAFV